MVTICPSMLWYCFPIVLAKLLIVSLYTMKYNLVKMIYSLLLLAVLVLCIWLPHVTQLAEGLDSILLTFVSMVWALFHSPLHKRHLVLCLILYRMSTTALQYNLWDWNEKQMQNVTHSVCKSLHHVGILIPSLTTWKTTVSDSYLPENGTKNTLFIEIKKFKWYRTGKMLQHILYTTEYS